MYVPPAWKPDLQIGGAVLFELLHSGAKLDITALVRSKDSASKLPKEVKTIVGANEDYDVLRDAASHANIVIHTANSADDEHGPEAIAEGLSKNGGWYIHTSGVSCRFLPLLTVLDWGYFSECHW